MAIASWFRDAHRIDGMLKKLGLEDGEAITHRWINKALENAQKKVEAIAAPN